MKKVAGIIIACILIIGVILLNKYYLSSKDIITQPKSTSQPTIKQITVYQKISISPEETLVFSKQEISAQSTALDLLKQTTKIKANGEGQNAFVVEINGRAADNKKKEYWAFFVNGQPATVGAGSYQLKENDQIEWKIATY